MPNHTSKMSAAATLITLPVKIITLYGTAFIEYDSNAVDSFVYAVRVNDGHRIGRFRDKHKAWISAVERLAAVDQKGPGAPADHPDLPAA